VEQCKALLALELKTYASGVGSCVHVPLPDARFVALTSFAYNVGVKAACGSSAVKLINQGRTAEGCESLLKWNRAAGIVFPGLTRRRQKERAFCLEGI
jgi:lysozyme